MPKGLHTWELDTWPADVWPHNSKRAQWLGRAYRKELVAAGAMSRMGKKLVFVGEAYVKWIQRRARLVDEWESNNPAMRRATEEHEPGVLA